MTQDEIIKMAEEAGLYYNKSAFVWTSPTAINLYPEGVHPTALEDFAKLVAQHEREACAVAAEKESLRGLPEEQPEGEALLRACAQIAGGVLFADAIRARGQA